MLDAPPCRCGNQTEHKRRQLNKTRRRRRRTHGGRGAAAPPRHACNNPQRSAPAPAPTRTLRPRPTRAGGPVRHAQAASAGAQRRGAGRGGRCAGREGRGGGGRARRSGHTAQLHRRVRIGWDGGREGGHAVGDVGCVPCEGGGAGGGDSGGGKGAKKRGARTRTGADPQRRGVARSRAVREVAEHQHQPGGEEVRGTRGASHGRPACVCARVRPPASRLEATRGRRATHERAEFQGERE